MSKWLSVQKAVAVLLVVQAVAARAEWLNGYVFRRLLTVTNQAVIASDQTNFPILVKLSASNFTFPHANMDGHDVRFTAADGTTVLSFERERHDAGAETAEYWVKLPSLASGSATAFYLYYRPADTVDGADPANVWDENYCLVQHVKETSGGSVYDSTANAVTGTVNAVTLGAEGFIGYGAQCPSTISNIKNSNPVARPTSATFEMWYKPNAVNGFLFHYNGGGMPGYLLQVNATSNLVSSLHYGNGYIATTGTTALAMGEWCYVADIYGAAAPLKRQTYLDGLLEAGSASGSLPWAGFFAEDQRNGHRADGVVDEFRMSKVARSADWIAAQNASMRNCLLDFGQEETGEAAWLDDYAFRRLLTVTNLAAIASGQTDFPILVKLTSANFSFCKSNADGHDVRFTAADGTSLLSYERERHDANTGAAEYWVRLPMLASAAETDFFMYYRSADTADGADPANVWNENYCLVQHVKETGGDNVYDSTANAVTGTVQSVTLGAEGYIGYGALCPSGWSNIKNAKQVARPTAATFEMWYKPNAVNGYLFMYTGDGNPGYSLLVNSASNLVSSLHYGNGYIATTGTTALAMGEWRYVADIYGAALPLKRQTYLDGVLEAGSKSASFPWAGFFELDQRNGHKADGIVDEFRVSKVARSADWIAAQNASMRDRLLNYGLELSRCAGSVVIVR